MSVAFICFTAVMACVAMIAIGVLLRRIGHIPPETDAVVLRLCINVLMPSLILDNILYTHAFDNPQNLYLPPLVSFAMVLIGMGLAYVVVRSLPPILTGINTPDAARTFAVAIGIFNYGFVPVPIVQTMFTDGVERSSMLAVLFVQNLGVELSIWTVGIVLLAGGWQRGAWRKVINGPTLAIVVGVVLNLIYRRGLLPPLVTETILPNLEFVRMTIHYLAGASIPISVVLVGTTMADMFNGPRLRREWRRVTRVAFWSIVLRMIVLPPLFLLVAVYLPCSVEMKRVLVIHAAMASAIFTTVLARYTGNSPEIAFDTVTSNTLASVVTAPFWIAIGMAWIA
ncbi:MAG: AEC family transporter [Thermoguttaceae bacterium]